MKHLFFLLRPKQWTKNLFIFLPLIFGKKLFIYPANVESVMAFILFCMVSSIVYVINDIMDIEKDRLHPIKKQRPIALGKISARQAFWVAAFLGVVSVPLSFLLNIRFGMVVLVYLIFNLIYSKFLKEAVIIDVFCIAFFFLLRVLAGSAVSRIELSHWIIFMITLLALFLGFNKRRQEIVLFSERAEGQRKVLEKYNIYFIDQMSSVVAASIVIVYMLYTVDARTINVFRTNHLIYTIPFVYYGIFRYLYVMNSNILRDEDPTKILFSDKKTQLNIILWIITCIAVIYFGL